MLIIGTPLSGLKLSGFLGFFFLARRKKASSSEREPGGAFQLLASQLLCGVIDLLSMYICVFSFFPTLAYPATISPRVPASPRFSSPLNGGRLLVSVAVLLTRFPITNSLRLLLASRRLGCRRLLLSSLRPRTPFSSIAWLLSSTFGTELC